MNFWLLLSFAFVGISVTASQPKLPTTNEVTQYQREKPVFQTTKVQRQTGDALLTALRGAEFQSWGEAIRNEFGTNQFACVLPPPPHTSLSLSLTNGSRIVISMTRDCGLIEFPEGFYAIKGRSRSNVATVIEELDKDIKQEILNTPKPFIYAPCTLQEDRGTLSGIARVFYGDASKWKVIYEANRKQIKNPNVIDSSMKLTIPKVE